MRIDCQTHIFSREYAQLLARNTGSPQAVVQQDGCVVTYGEGQKFWLKWEEYSVERKIRAMDAAGIELLQVELPD